MDREAAISRLKAPEPFDVLVIGGGATGTGIALDAASRGLSVALVEREDFSYGTSSRSTKLIHGGVRYLELAVKQLDRGQYKLVSEALSERTTLLKIAPHLVRPLALLTPVYGWLQAPYYWSGLKLYDWIAGRSALDRSRYLTPREALERLPALNPSGLKGAVVYSDGQFNDARMNVALAVTAAEQGAAIANHVRVDGLLKDKGRVTGALVADELTGEQWEIRARVVINATGPFVDAIRRLDDPSVPPLLAASSGSHIVLDGTFSAAGSGMLIPKTRDGRVLFVLPWLGHTLVGTTDNPAPIEADPKATEADIAFILRELGNFLVRPVRREDILASWCGLRPLVRDPKASDTAGISRDHTIHVSPSQLVTVTGGKWTTYRRMAADAVGLAIQIGKLPEARGAHTQNLPLAGAEGFSPELAAQLERRYGLAADVADHLAHSYGTRAHEIAGLAQGDAELGRRLAADYPFIEAEVVYGARVESARTVKDILFRRLRLGFLNHRATREAWPLVVSRLARTLDWDPATTERERTSPDLP